MPRIATIERKTSETDLHLNLDGTEVADVATGIGFLDHMLSKNLGVLWRGSETKSVDLPWSNMN